MPEEAIRLTDEMPERRLRDKYFRDSRLGQLVLTNLIGLAWGNATFEGGSELAHEVFNVPFPGTTKEQLLGAGLFSAAGIIYAKWIRSEIKKNDPNLIPAEDLRLQVDI